jgi:hypothetical protein
MFNDFEDHSITHGFQYVQRPILQHWRMDSRGDHSLLCFAYTCIWDLFIGRVIYLAKKIIRWRYFTWKKLENIICDGILHVNMFHYSKIPYFTCKFFTKFTYWTLFFIARCSTIFAQWSLQEWTIWWQTTLKKLDVLQDIHDMGHCPWGRTFATKVRNGLALNEF